MWTPQPSPGAGPPVRADAHAFREWCRLLYVPGDVFQVQVRDGDAAWSGVYHFNDLDDVVAHLDQLATDRPEAAVGLTVNPVRPELLSQGVLAPVHEWWRRQTCASAAGCPS